MVKKKRMNETLTEGVTAAARAAAVLTRKRRKSEPPKRRKRRFQQSKKTEILCLRLTALRVPTRLNFDSRTCARACS